MNTMTLRINKRVFRLTTAFLVLILSAGSQALAGDLSPDVQAKVDAYKQKLTQWSNDKDVINAIKEMNTRVVNMSNETWKTLANDAPEVMQYQTNPAGKKLIEWQKDKALGKLFLRDQKGNYVAGSKKPAIFNIAERKPFKSAMTTGKTWNSAKPKADPTTHLSSIQISAPVISEGKQIGIIHTSLIVE